VKRANGFGVLLDGVNSYVAEIGRRSALDPRIGHYSQLRTSNSVEPETNSGPEAGAPSIARLYRVAAGLSQWTDSEVQWLREHPEWLEYYSTIKDANEPTGAQLC